MDDVERLKQIVEQSDKIVFFGGAGVSTASGIPDFRSATGLYNKKNDSDFSPEYMLSHEFFVTRPDLFQNYVLENLIIDGVKPNKAHLSLTKLEKANKLLGVITQNIDSLDKMAGTKNIAEIHGNLRDYYCVNCGAKYDLDYYKQNRPCKCEKCGGVVRPDVTLYGDTMIVAGSSLVVYPASGLINYFRGDNLILINLDRTSYDNMANIVIHDDIAKTLEYVTRDIDER